MCPEEERLRAEVRRLLDIHIDLLTEAYRRVFMVGAQAAVQSRFSRVRSLLREELARTIANTLSEDFGVDAIRCDRMTATFLPMQRTKDFRNLS